MSLRLPSAQSRRLGILLVTLLLAFVGFRSYLFVRYPQAHFDSDQAVYGIMAQDLAEGHTIPFYMYGQRYLLAVNVWITAPFFALFGPDLGVHKAAMLLPNFAIVLLLWFGLRPEASLGPWGTALAILPFALPGVITSSRLIEQAGSIEPFVFVLIAYFVRERPWLLGFVLAIAFLNREFSAVALPALLIMELLQRRLLRRWKCWLITLITAMLIIQAGRAIGEFGPEFHGPKPLFRRPHIDNLSGLLVQQLPTLLEGKPQTLAMFNIPSSLHVGLWLVSAAFAVWLLFLLITLASQPPTRAELDGFSTYLILVGGGQLLGFVLFTPTPANPMLLRYVLFALLSLVGLIAFAYRRAALRGITVVLFLSVTGLHLVSHSRLMIEYSLHEPQRDIDHLARALEGRNIHYLRAEYWTAYDLTFNTRGRVIASPPPGDFRRIDRLEALLEQNRREIYELSTTPSEGSVEILKWHLRPAP